MKNISSQMITDEAIQQAMEESLPSLRAFARGLCLDHDYADDLVQSACTRALERLHQVTELSGVKSWLNRILYTQWQDTLRNRQRRGRKIVEFSHYLTAGQDSRRGQAERARAARIDVEFALAQIGRDLRAAVVLTSMLGYSYQEASVVLEVPPGTVASRVARARSRMAEILSAESKVEVQSSFNTRGGAVHG